MNIIAEEQVAQIVDTQRAFVAIEKSYLLYSSGKTVTPQTVSMSVNDGMFYSFPAFIEGSPIFISKQATDYRKNREQGLPTVHPYILVFHSETGVLETLIEGRYFAAVRTALSSAVGVKYLASHRNTLAVLGSGVQGKAHVRVLTELFPEIREVRMYSRTQEHLDVAIRELEGVRAKVLAISSASQAISGADIVVTATSSDTPVFDVKDVRTTALIIGVGAMKYDQEIPADVFDGAQVVVDAKSNIPMYDEIAHAREAGHDLHAIVEIGEVVADASLAAWEGKTIFKHHGLPITDAALAEIVIAS